MPTTHLNVLAEPQVIVGERATTKETLEEKEEEVLEWSLGEELERIKKGGVSAAQSSPTESQRTPVFRGLSLKARKRSIRRNKPRYSRSSTMPGLSVDTERQRAYKTVIRDVERNTGHLIQDNEAARKIRREIHGQAMYKNSAACPDSLAHFAWEIHSEERITRKQEIELGELTQEAIRLQTLYDTLEERLEREPTDEEWCAASGKINMESIRQAIQDGLEAKDKLVTSNLRMVQSVVNTYIRNGLTAQYNAGDLMQEGIMALIRAAEKFEPSRGWKFSTYAMYWVRAGVKRSQITQSRVVAVPQRLFETHKRLLRVKEELKEVLGRQPTRAELGAEIGLSEIQVDRCFEAMTQQCFSLDQEIHNSKKPGSNNSRKDTLIDFVSNRHDPSIESPSSRFLQEDLLETLNRHLPPLEVELLLLRYGLKECGIPMKIGRQPTIAEISEVVGLKPDKVRRLIQKSLRQLRGAGLQEWISFERDL